MRLVAAFGVLSLIPLSFAISGTISDASQVNGQAFDYVVIGGGLSGLVVANRLSEDQNVTVLVIEAGNDSREDEQISLASSYAQAWGGDMDWKWTATDGKKLIGGKTLGGGTAINGMTYTRGEAAQYDALGKLTGDDAGGRWTWSGMFAVMKRSERFTSPSADQQALGASYNPAFHGTAGPLSVTYPDTMYKGPQQGAFKEVAGNFSIPSSSDADGGQAANVAFHSNMVSNTNGQVLRASSATSYWSPIEHQRSNIAVLVQQMATKIVTTGGGSGNVSATGVQLGDSVTVNVNREVIVSAGAIQSAVLLQLSGIGDPAVLQPLGVDVVVDLPGVGKNLQDQTMCQIQMSPGSLNIDGQGPSDIIAYPTLQALFGDDTATIKQTITGNVDAYARDAAANGGLVSTAAGSEIFGTQADLMVNGGVGVGELFLSSQGNNSLNLMMWNLLPFSRGSVNISSTDASANPNINARFLSADVDMQIQIKGSRLARKMLGTDPLRSLVGDETSPSTGSAPDGVPDNDDGGSDDDWGAWIYQHFDMVNHWIGSCSMMKRELGGVVDANLRVYGTKNIRVVDGSVLPMQLSAHLSATLYGLAENAADIIKSGTTATDPAVDPTGGTNTTTTRPYIDTSTTTTDPTLNDDTTTTTPSDVDISTTTTELTINVDISTTTTAGTAAFIIDASPTPTPTRKCAPPKRRKMEAARRKVYRG